MRRQLTDPEALLWKCLFYLCLATTLSAFARMF